MLPRRRCPFCRRWFHPHPRLKERQKTCGRAECRREQKRRFNQKWRKEQPDYFRGTYALQKEKYGTRAEEKRRYREQHPDYLRRNAVFVQKWRQQQRQAPVSPTSSSALKLRVRKDFQARIDVSPTSPDIVVSLCSPQTWRKVRV